MAATITTLQTRPDRLRADQADQLRLALAPLEADMPDAVRSIRAHIDRASRTRSKWTFIMLSPEQNAAVVNYIAANSSRPVVAMRLWAACFTSLDYDSGQIMLTRSELAARVGETPDNVSTIMTELVKFGAISRRRDSGNGQVRYFMNPRVATHLAGKERDDAQAAAPQLRLV
jgi:CRP-like cAMP-binding protein